MKLSYYDDFGFAVVGKNGTFAVNPAQNDAKLLFALFTSPDRRLDVNERLLTWSGEYEFGGVAIQLFPLPDDFLGARVVSEEVTMLFLPVCPRELSEQEKELLGNIDVLVINVRETDASLKKLVEEIDPKIIVPVGPQQEKFLLEMGAGNADVLEEFSFDFQGLPADKTGFVKLQAL